MLRRITDPIFGFIGWAWDQFDMWPCQIGIHTGEKFAISDGHHARRCERCFKIEWLD
jgi:hypothetical protein